MAFASHLDGSKHLITPERSIEIQRLLGSDIVMAFDELVALPAERSGRRGGNAAVDALGGAVTHGVRRR